MDDRETFFAGGAVADLTPSESVFLFGYPHVPRMSTGVHDPLECAVLYLRCGSRHAMFIANDVIFVPKPQAERIRREISQRTGVPAEAIMVTATHTHSGPVMTDYISNAADPVVPKADPEYLDFFCQRVISTAESAFRSVVPAEVGFSVVPAPRIGSNRHDPAGPFESDVPVLLARAVEDHSPIACMFVCAMHPTVLHEDSTLVSADFPGFTRRFLRGSALPPQCPVLFHQGASGNQSPRHVTHGNTFAEARRLGELLGQSLAQALRTLDYVRQPRLGVRQEFLPLELRSFPSPDDALRLVTLAEARLQALRSSRATRQAIRTAECDLFGAEETAELARAAGDGRLASAVQACLPAEIQAFTVGPWRLIGWPGEFFVEYALELRRRVPGAFVITLANGELQGYIVTDEAVSRGAYEANNAVFSATNGPRMVSRTVELLSR